MQLAGKFYDKKLIDLGTKSEVKRLQGKYEGPDTLMDYVELKVDLEPAVLPTVLTAMKEVEILSATAGELMHQGPTRIQGI